jgi:hypothetical protein
MLSRAAVAVSAVLALAVSVHGQGLRRRGPVLGPAIPVAPIQLQGTVAGVRPGMVAVTTAAGETWALKITPRSEVRVTGTAEPDVLRPGMYVRFIAPIDTRRSLVQGEVEKLVIFSPSEEVGRMPGVFYPGQEGEDSALEPGAGGPPNVPGGRNPADVQAGPPRGRNPGVKPKALPPARRENALPGGRAGQDADANASGGHARMPYPATGTAAGVETFDVRGRLTGLKGRWLTVYARNAFFKPMLKFELADKPVIKLDVNTYSLAKPGDKISARGVQIGPQAVQAMQVTIELVEPLGSSGQKPDRTAARRDRRRGTKSGGGREPFEVAEEVEKGKPAQAQQAPPPQKQEQRVSPETRSKEIRQFLEAKPEEIRGKPGVKLNPTHGDPITFAPCKQVAAKEVLGRFGLPDQVQKIKGSLPLGEGGRQQEIQWQLWSYGPVMFFVDEADRTRYLALTPQQKQQPPEEKQAQPPQAKP